jgi:hypothetical protein
VVDDDYFSDNMTFVPYLMNDGRFKDVYVFDIILQ